MKGVILAGGTGSRLHPLTKVTNKHLLPVYDKPMIYYPIETLVNSDIKDILIITGKESAGDFLNLLGSGDEFGCTFSYKIQEKAGGIAEAISLAEDFSKGEDIAVILGDNIFEESFGYFFDVFARNELGAAIIIKEVEDPRRFGVVEMNDNDEVISIEEKPENPKSNWAQTGLYIYDNRVFDFIRDLDPSERGELEVTDLNNIYLSLNELYCHDTKGYWIDAGTFDSLYLSNKKIYEINKSREKGEA